MSDITLKLNENNVKPVAKRTVQYHLHEIGFKRIVQRKKLLIKEVNRKKRLSWCREKRRWSFETTGKELYFRMKVRL